LPSLFRFHDFTPHFFKMNPKLTPVMLDVVMVLLLLCKDNNTLA
jgi:hypothetical protein